LKPLPISFVDRLICPAFREYVQNSFRFVSHKAYIELRRYRSKRKQNNQEQF